MLGDSKQATSATTSLIYLTLGGFISSVIFNYGPGDTNFHVGGLIMSTIGAMIVLSCYAWSAKRNGSV